MDISFLSKTQNKHISQQKETTRTKHMCVHVLLQNLQIIPK